MAGTASWLPTPAALLLPALFVKIPPAEEPHPHVGPSSPSGREGWPKSPALLLGAVAALVPACTKTHSGSGHHRAAFLSTPAVRVAETRTVCRPPSRRFPACCVRRSRSSRKLGASSWSASSSTISPVRWVASVPRRLCSARRPGVPTTMIGWWVFSASSCRWMFAPPMSCCTAWPASSGSSCLATLRICMASSREGATMMAVGPSLARSEGSTVLSSASACSTASWRAGSR
mmetsp:Transcript_9439/g.26934  ORF Transcript_9439/g.26934 Transcript_9439/m.26934 type:complete len:232 (+) Transcript_9439:578-1273(+)